MTIDNTVIVAIIGLVSATLVCLINNYFTTRNISRQQSNQMEELLRQQNAQAQDMIAHNEQSIAIMQCSVDEAKREIERLRAEMEKHNRVVERTFKLEEKMSVMEEKMTVANHRINDLEKK